MKAAVAGFASLLDAYGALFLAKGWPVGALVLTATLCDPATGFCGIAAGLVALAARGLLRLPALPGEADLINAVYAGLALGAFHAAEPRSFALAAFGGLLAVLLCAALRRVLAGPPGGRGLPLLGAPFLCTAWTLLAVARALALPLRWSWPAWPDWLPQALASPLANVGGLFYVAHPLAGILVLAALLLASRALALLALGGSLLATALVALAAPPAPGLALLAPFNGALAAIFLGGVLAVPGRRALAVAAGGVLLATALSAGMLALASPFGIPPLSAPCLLAVWLVYGALRPESSGWWSRFWLPVPACPEASLVGSRLAAARGLAGGSIALVPPHAGRMEVSQGMDGAHTHQGPWRYALDFVRLTDGLSYRGEGDELADFHAFGLPVLSPAWGTVAAARGDILDNRPGEMNLTDNWGNHVLIDIGGNLYVLLAHLRQGSIRVAAGQKIAPGTLLAECGNSGRSAQPHLHLHVQRGAALGGPTVPFHLTHCLVDGGQYVLDGCPGEGRSIESAPDGPALFQACAPAPGREWKFVAGGREWRLGAALDLHGETFLLSGNGGRLLAACGSGLLGLYRRHGAPDRVLDAFALAFGLTPFSPRASNWRDAPDASLLPLTAWQRLALVLRQPFGANVDSRYERTWEPGQGLWRQRGRHRVATALGKIEFESLGWISESLGPVAFRLHCGNRVLADAALTGYGNRGDHGIPAWSASHSPILGGAALSARNL